MKQRPIVPRQVDLHPAEDAQALRVEGIERLRELAGEVWTDHNVHDPGITILESACVALADLGYRTGHPIEDLLARPGGATRDLFTAAEVLPCNALTALDYRKLFIDLPGVANAWIVTVASVFPYAIKGEVATRQTEETPQGLYDVLFEAEPEYSSQALAPSIAQAYRCARNLGEDLRCVSELEPVKLRLCVDLEVDPLRSVNEVHAQALSALEVHFRTDVQFKSLKDRRADGVPIEAIFEGPQPQHGFVVDASLLSETTRVETLTAQTATVYGSDLVRVLMTVEGVRAVRQIDVAATHAGAPYAHRSPRNGWSWTFARPAADVPVVLRLDVETSRLRFFHGLIPLSSDTVAALARLSELRGRRGWPRLRPMVRDLAPPTGRVREIAALHSLRRLLPAAYMVAPGEFPSHLPAQRQLEARRLQAWLLFFDQLVADGLANLAHAGERLSVSAGVATTRFSQPVLDDDAVQLQHPSYEVVRPTLVEDDGQWRRRARMLAHQLARYGEDTEGYALAVNPGGGPTAQTTQDAAELLSGVDVLARDRGRAFDYTGHCDHPTGLRQRVRARLGMAARLVEWRWHRVRLYQTGTARWRFEIFDDEGRSVLITPATRSFPDLPALFAELEALRARLMITAPTLDGEGAAVGLVVWDADGARQLAVSPSRGDHATASRRAEALRGWLDALDMASPQVTIPVRVGSAWRGSRRRFGWTALNLKTSAPLLDWGPFATDELPEALGPHVEEALGGGGVPPAMTRKARVLIQSALQEDMHVVEHILLRPRASSIGLEVPVEPKCAASLGPYAFRLTIVLPAWSLRVRQRVFRAYAERVIREEIPAHLSARICWVSRASYLEFMEAYAPWRAALRALEGVICEPPPSVADTIDEASKALFEALSALRSVFPPITLHDCSDPSESPAVLGFSTLGEADP